MLLTGNQPKPRTLLTMLEAIRLLISITAEHNTIVLVVPKIVQAVCSSSHCYHRRFAHAF